MPITIAIYIVLTYAANWKVRSRWMLLFPLYALFQVMVLTWCGIYRYIKTATKCKNIGRIRMVNNPNNVSIFNIKGFYKLVTNYSIIAVSMFVILLGTSNMTQQVVFGKTYEPAELVVLASESCMLQISKIGKFIELDNGDVAEQDVVDKASAGYGEIENYYEITIEKGEGKTHIARKAINDYIKDNAITLLKKQKIYAEDGLRRSFDVLGGCEEGARVRLDKKSVAAYVILALAKIEN
ncbi:MAG: hypothetical protein HY764_01430 [Candidatus Portnoybacteria bacterium]|nr:hypothetical protein [Candidatus Portnoybacteria bacterium]